MHNQLPDHIMEHIKHHIDHIRPINMGDRLWWIKTSTGKFSVKSAWEILRNKEEENVNFKKIWVQDLPFKIPFFSWNPNQSQLCLCYTVPTMEIMKHLFLKLHIEYDNIYHMHREY